MGENRRTTSHSEKNPTERKSRGNYITKAIVVIILLCIAGFILAVSPNYRNDDIKDKTNVIINNKNITNSLKKNVYIDDKGNIYLSREDLKNFFDSDIYYNDPYNQIITTSGSKIAVLVINQNEMKVNDTLKKISAPAIKKDETFYLPMSELSSIYNIEVRYIEETDILLIDSTDREQVKADASKNISVKSKMKTFSRTVDKVKKGDKVVLISTDEGWAKVRTENGKIGYVKESVLANQVAVREKAKEPEKMGKVSLVWDYYSEYVKCPNRNGQTFEGVNVVSPAFFVLQKLGKGEIIDKAGAEGSAYVKWAKSKGYKVWAMFANDSMIETTSEIMRDYKLREKTINSIVNLALKYELDGINVDFENMYKEDKDLFTRFIIELYPRLKEHGITLSVCVTAPDGGDTWSLCFDRYNIAKNSDYMMLMAYDQHGNSSIESGSVAGYDWVKVNLKKFVEKKLNDKGEEIITENTVDKDKLILGIPLYTRLWKENSEGKITDRPTVAVKDVNNAISRNFPSSSQKTWDEDVKQYYIEGQNGNSILKMWIEDKESIKAKLDLAEELGLGGVAFWQKDMESQDIWNIVDEYLKK